MALGAHEVPVLERPGPVQGILVVDLLLRVEVIPALAALAGRARVPRDAQRLEAAPGKLQEVLLQGIDAEGVGDPVLLQRAVRPVGADQVPAVAAGERRGHAVLRERRAVEVAPDGARVGRQHGQGVIGALPPLGLGRRGTRRRPGRRRRRGRRRHGRRGRWRGLGGGAVAAAKKPRRRQEPQPEQPGHHAHARILAERGGPATPRTGYCSSILLRVVSSGPPEPCMILSIASPRLKLPGFCRGGPIATSGRRERARRRREREERMVDRGRIELPTAGYFSPARSPGVARTSGLGALNGDPVGSPVGAGTSTAIYAVSGKCTHCAEPREAMSARMPICLGLKMSMSGSLVCGLIGLGARVAREDQATIDAAFTSGAQPPWKPNGTRTGKRIVAIGSPAKSWASRMTTSLRSRSGS